MRNYESVLIFSPELEAESIEKSLDKVKSVILAGNGRIVDVDHWGIRKLAYQIKHINDGYYVLVYFQAEPEVIATLSESNRYLNGILRQMTCLSIETKRFAGPEETEEVAEAAEAVAEDTEAADEDQAEVKTASAEA